MLQTWICYQNLSLVRIQPHFHRAGICFVFFFKADFRKIQSCISYQDFPGRVWEKYSLMDGGSYRLPGPGRNSITCRLPKPTPDYSFPKMGLSFCGKTEQQETRISTTLTFPVFLKETQKGVEKQHLKESSCKGKSCPLQGLDDLEQQVSGVKEQEQCW